MATITKKKYNLSGMQGLDQAKTQGQADAGLIPSTPKVETPKIDTTPVITSQIQPQANSWDVANTTDQASRGLIPSQSVQTTPVEQTAQTSATGPTNDQNLASLKTSADRIAEDAKKEQTKLQGDLTYGAQQRDYQQEVLKSTTETAQQRLDRQLADQKIQIDRAISDTQRNSERNLAILEKTAALQGTGKSSGFGSGLQNIKEDTLRTINRLQEDLTRAQQATGEEAKVLWQNFNRNKEKIDNDFEYQFRDFTNWQAASIAELTSAGYSPEKMNKALDKIYETAQYKTQELFTNYINNYQALNSETRLQAEEIRTQEQFRTNQQKDFINQYIGYNGEMLGSQTLDSLKQYLDSGSISQNDYNLYSKMMSDNTLATLQQYGTPKEIDLQTIQSLLTKGYTPTEALAYMIQANPDRFKPQQDSKAPNIQKIGVDADGNDIYGYYDTQTQSVVPISGGSLGGTTQPYTGEFGDLTGIVKRTGNNVGKDTNNPGNIMADSVGQKELAKRYGAIGFYSSPNGRTYAVFNSMEDGKNAMMQDLQSKINGGSSRATANTTLGNFASGWVSGPNAPTNQAAVTAYTRYTGFPANTPIGQIPLDTLATAIMKHEGVDPTKSATIGVPQGQIQGGDLSMQVAGLTQGLGGTEGERQKLQDNIVKVAQRDGISLQEAKKKLGYKTADDVEFAKARKEQLSAITKSSDAIRNGKQTLNLLANENTAIGDVSTVFSFLKTLDPQSVARESEVASVTNAQSLLGRLEVTFNKLKSGKTLTEQQRTEMKSAIQTIVDAYENNLRDTISSSKQEFDSRGLDASVYISKNLLDKYGTQTQQTPQTTQTNPLANPTTKSGNKSNEDYLKSLGITS